MCTGDGKTSAQALPRLMYNVTWCFVSSALAYRLRVKECDCAWQAKNTVLC